MSVVVQGDDVMGSRDYLISGTTAPGTNSHAEELPPENNCVGIMSHH